MSRASFREACSFSLHFSKSSRRLRLATPEHTLLEQSIIRSPGPGSIPHPGFSAAFSHALGEQQGRRIVRRLRGIHV